MNTDIAHTTPSSLAEQRESLRQRLVAQRVLLTSQLAPTIDSPYPRSMTMRFLNRRSIPAAKIFAGFATVMFGLRLARSIKTTLSVVRLFRSNIG
jgi:hypothetical protein